MSTLIIKNGELVEIKQIGNGPTCELTLTNYRCTIWKINTEDFIIFFKEDQNKKTELQKEREIIENEFKKFGMIKTRVITSKALANHS